MNARFRHLLAATAVLACALAFPAIAAAHKPPPSALDVYVEKIQTAGGSKPLQTSNGKFLSGASVPLSQRAARKLQSRGGTDRSTLLRIATSRGLGVETLGGSAARVKSPGTLGAAFDLSAPTALLAVLAGAALLVGGAIVRRRHLR